VRRLEDGSLIMRSPYDFPTPPENVGVWLRKWAADVPDRLFISKYAGDGNWQGLTYGDALRLMKPVAQNLVKRKLSAQRPLMTFSKNGIENALLQLAAMDIGVPVIPLSPALSLDEKNHEVLRRIITDTTPGLVFAADGAPFEVALKIAADAGAEIVVEADPPKGVKVTPFHKLIKSWRTRGADDAYAGVTSETVAKVYYTGAESGDAAGYVMAQGAMCANQTALATLLPVLKANPPVVVDDAPWYRAGTGALVFNMVLCNGGTLYIDRFGLEKRIADFASPSPTIHVTEPMALYTLLTRMESDPLLAEDFFRQLELVWVIGGALSEDAAKRFSTLASDQEADSVVVIASYGDPATSSISTCVTFETDISGNLGLPVPGTYLKLIADGDSYELATKGSGPVPSVWRGRESVPASSDEDGFVKSGERVALVDPMRPYLGLVREIPAQAAAE